MLFQNDKLNKMVICVLNHDGERSVVDESQSFTVQVNPESYSFNRSISYQHAQSNGTKDETATFTKNDSSILTFDIIFDGTGVVSDMGSTDEIPLAGAIASVLGAGDQEYDVDAKIKEFETIVYQMDSGTHGPHKLKVFWGKLEFEGYLNSVSYTYTLFKPDGTPLRAKASCSFRTSMIQNQSEREAAKESPDLTHLRTLGEEDSLPLLAHREYGNSNLYLEIARANNLVNFRRLSAGTKLQLPPIEKSGKKATGGKVIERRVVAQA